MAGRAVPVLVGVSVILNVVLLAGIAGLCRPLRSRRCRSEENASQRHNCDGDEAISGHETKIHRGC